MGLQSYLPQTEPCDRLAVRPHTEHGGVGFRALLDDLTGGEDLAAQLLPVPRDTQLRLHQIVGEKRRKLRVEPRDVGLGLRRHDQGARWRSDCVGNRHVLQ